MQLVFLVFAGIATIMFVLLLFSILGKDPGSDVRERMEQYLIESEKAAKEEYALPEDALETEEDEEAKEGDEEGDWTSELRGSRKKGKHENAKKILANMGAILTPKGMAAKIADQLAKADIPLKAKDRATI